MKLNPQFFIIIVFLSLYHFYINNGLEKIFSQTYFGNYNIVRPLFGCSNQASSSRLKCIGMPSGHAETASLFFFLLYFYKVIPLWICLLFISLISIQKIISSMHSYDQVIVGSTLGLVYALIYKKFNLSLTGFLIVFCIGIVLSLLSSFNLKHRHVGKTLKIRKM